MNYLLWSSGFGMGNWIVQKLPIFSVGYFIGAGVFALIVLFNESIARFIIQYFSSSESSYFFHLALSTNCLS